MNQEQKDTITTRVVSTIFTVLALAIFKPFGLQTWQWMAVVHLSAMGCLGFVSCALTEAILKHVIKKPRSLERGVDYIISRNLWFQLINTPLVALLICLYRHFVMSDLVPGNVLSWGNFLETLLIIAFCSFAIGLYWRFKFRSKYLTAELMEVRLLNEQLQRLQQEAECRDREADAARIAPMAQDNLPAAVATTRPDTITLTGSTSESVTLQVFNLLYAEAVGNYVKIIWLHNGKVRSDMLRTTSKRIEEDLHRYPMVVRCHRAFLVNLHQVEQIASSSGSMRLVLKHCDENLPVSRSNMAQVKEAIKGVRNESQG